MRTTWWSFATASSVLALGCAELLSAELDGTGGASSGQATPLDFSHCRQPPLQSSTCSLPETQAVLRCGEPGEILDRQCCLRPRCYDEVECTGGARCIPRLNQSPDAFGGSVIEGCSMERGACVCTVTSDIDFAGYCIPEGEIPAYDCAVFGRSCEELFTWHNQLSLAWNPRIPGEPLSFLDRRMDACGDAVDRELAARCRQIGCVCPDDGGSCSSVTPTFCVREDVLGCPLTLERARAPAGLCERGAERVTYSECADGTVRLDWFEGGETHYALAFDLRTGNLLGAEASGFVGGPCGLDASRRADVRAGATAQSAECRSCDVCAAGSGQAPGCAFDANGRIVFP